MWFCAFGAPQTRCMCRSKIFKLSTIQMGRRMLNLGRHYSGSINVRIYNPILVAVTSLVKLNIHFQRIYRYGNIGTRAAQRASGIIISVEQKSTTYFDFSPHDII
jgi:hypothetical protein